MKIANLARQGCVVAFVFAATAGCREERKPRKAPTPVPPSRAVKPTPAKKPHAAPHAPATVAPQPTAPQPTAAHTAPNGKGETVLTHGGITFTVPAGWEPQIVEPGPLAAKASYKLPGVAGDAAACTVRVTHYPNMRGRPGMDDSNINRWVSQVKKPDGSSMTREDAKVETMDLGSVQVILVDLEGSVSVGMSGGGAAATGQRMINAIVNHANGPHFIKAIGPSAAMANSADAIKAFIKSAKPAT